MKKDMHFYGVYALARAAGVKSEAAHAIAYSSQFVDDAIYDEAIIVEGNQAVLPVVTSHKPFEIENTLPGDQWKVWLPFHFIPGDKPKAKLLADRLVCLPGKDPHDSYRSGRLTGKILDFAIEKSGEIYGPHLVGVTAHAFADTFAHFGFIGLRRDDNKVDQDSIVFLNGSDKHKKGLWETLLAFGRKYAARMTGSLAELVPVGHGTVGTLPDIPYLHWKYTPEIGGKPVDRNNYDYFFKACEELHKFFVRYADKNDAVKDMVVRRDWDDIKDKVSLILRTIGETEERIEAWKIAMISGDLFPSTDIDKSVAYFVRLWSPERLAQHFYAGRSAEECGGCLFYRAAWKYRSYFLNELMQEVEILK